MFFLGQASNYKPKDILRHTFAHGSIGDFSVLRNYLAARYDVHPDQVALYGTGRSALASALQLVVKEESPTESPTKKRPKSATKSTPKSLDPEKLLHPEVIITALTCYAVVQAVEYAGCTPVFADVEPETLHFGPDELCACLKKHPNARAIIIQNNLGHPVNMEEIEIIASQHNLKIIEDLAHSTGVYYPDGREAGTVGDATILSFGKGKSIDTIAGGALVVRDHTVPQPSKRPGLCNSMRARWYPFLGVLIRFFYRLNLGRIFTSLLIKLHFIERSADAPLRLDTRCTYWQAKLALRQLENLPSPRPPLRDFYFVKDRDKVLDKLEKHGFIFNDTWYDCPVAPERYFDKSGFTPRDCPTAVRLSKEIINFPTHYPKSTLKPARTIIKPYLIEEHSE